MEHGVSGSIAALGVVSVGSSPAAPKIIIKNKIIFRRLLLDFSTGINSAPPTQLAQLAASYVYMFLFVGWISAELSKIFIYFSDYFINIKYIQILINHLLPL